MKKRDLLRRGVLSLWATAGLILLVSQFTACPQPNNNQGPSNVATNSGTPAQPSASPGAVNAQGVRYVPVNPSMYVPSETIGKWSETFDDKAIEDHGWQIWAALTADSGQQYNGVELPVWDTWFSEFEVFCTDPRGVPVSADPCADSSATGEQKSRPFHIPRQVNTRASVVSFNKYNLDFKQFVQENKYYQKQTLEQLNASFAPDTPLQDRRIKTPPRTGIMLKPTFWIIKADTPTPMPIWQGPALSIAGTLQPKRPTDLTWTNVVLVDPTGRADNSQPITRTLVSETGTQQLTTPAGSYKVVPLSSFYVVPLSDEDVMFLKGGNAFQVGGLHSELGGINLNDWKPGDKLLALLVGMHVTTAEWDDFWTWQTFWWTPTPETTGHPGVGGPWANFNMASAYYMIGKDGQPHIAFNPHLETPIEGNIFMNPTERGSHSNCMTCHRVAAFPSVSNDPNPNNMTLRSYLGTGDIKRDNPVWFKNRVQTMNMWTMVLETMPQGWSPSAPSVTGPTPIQKPKKTP